MLPALPAAAAAVELDPIFALIEAHRAAHAVFRDALVLQTRMERTGDWQAASEASKKPCHDENGAFEALVTAPATTLRGLIAKFDYFQELSSKFETEWMVDDRACPSVLVESFAASLKNIGVLP